MEVVVARGAREARASSSRASRGRKGGGGLVKARRLQKAGSRWLWAQWGRRRAQARGLQQQLLGLWAERAYRRQLGQPPTPWVV